MRTNHTSTNQCIPGFYLRPISPISPAEREDDHVDPVELQEVMDTFTRYMLSLGHKKPKSLSQIREFLFENYGINLNDYRSFSNLLEISRKIKRNESKDNFVLEHYAK